MIEVHHVVPVSLFGIDKDCNKHPLEREIHRELHDILDMKKWTYWRLHRRERIHNNHKSILDSKDLDMRYDLQRSYFSSYSKLPEELQDIHDNKMLEMQKYYWWILEKITWNVYNIEKEDFHTMHEKQIEIHKFINEDLIASLKKHYTLQ